MSRPRRRLILSLGLIATLLPFSTWADEPDEPGAVVPSDPIFEALRTDGTTAVGRIRDLRLEGGEGRVVLVGDGDEEQTVALSKLVKLTRQGDAPPYPPEGSLLVLPDGDRLRALVNVSDQVKVEVLPFALGDVSVSIPLDRVLALVLAPPQEPGALETLLGQIRERAARGRGDLAHQRRPPHRQLPRPRRQDRRVRLRPGPRGTRPLRGRRGRVRPGPGRLSEAEVRLPEADDWPTAPDWA